MTTQKINFYENRIDKAIDLLDRIKSKSGGMVRIQERLDSPFYQSFPTLCVKYSKSLAMQTRMLALLETEFRNIIRK
jgi:hypothetical protein